MPTTSFVSDRTHAFKQSVKLHELSLDQMRVNCASVAMSVAAAATRHTRAISLHALRTLTFNNSTSYSTGAANAIHFVNDFIIDRPTNETRDRVRMRALTALKSAMSIGELTQLVAQQ